MSGERESLADTYIERLETALAAATHERDLAAERARLAGEGVEQLEERLRRRQAELEGERQAAERDLEGRAAEAEKAGAEELGRAEKEHAEALSRAEKGHAEALSRAEKAHREDVARVEKHLANAKAGIESRERRLEVSVARLELREEELERSREAEREAQAELRAARERLAQAERDLAEAGERLAERERELEAASTLLEAQGAELARARDAARESARERDELRERLGEAERARAEVAARLEAREKHLANAKAGVESRDRRLEAAERTAQGRAEELSSRETEIERLRAAAGEGDRRLALAEARLAKAQQRAETFRGSLVEIRSGRSYKLMRILWRLRRPFRRAPKTNAAADGAAEDAEPGPAGPPASAAPPLATSSRYAGRTRQPGERLRVASILDEMSEACFAPECELIPLTLERWREQLDERPPDLLLVESAWNGNGGEWQYRVAEYPRKDLAGLPALRALLDGCRERGIPTAFWNKEDPVHFERFAEAAALFDHVFTTDARCVERYRELPGGDRTEDRTVEALPFAAQPRIHNPAAVVPERSTSPCFAGAWYRDRHPERRRSLAALLDAARPRGLVIYDRSFGGKDGAFGFPERFAPHVLGKLPYERILDVYKSHRVFLNANSVADSPTMCSRRVFELAACDTAILSTPAVALEALLGGGVVAEAADEEAAAAALEQLLGDEGERRRRTRAARRKVFAEHTYAARLATIARTAGLDPSHADGERWQLLLQPGVELSAEAEADLRAAAVFAAADAIGVGVGNGRPAPEHRLADELDPRALLVSRELVESRGPLDGAPEQIQAQLRRWSDEGARLYAADTDLLALGPSQRVA